jgi:hypothetical protein
MEGEKASSVDVKAIRLRCNLLLYAAVQFVVLTTIAMFLYPGGYENGDEIVYHTTHYSFIHNFFSDLGATRTYTGQCNTISMMLFIIALASVGIALIIFSFNYTALTYPQGRLIKTGKVSVVIAAVSGLSFIGIASMPWNLQLQGHMMAVRFAFGFLLIYIVLMLAMQVKNDWGGWPIGLNIIYLVLLVVYVGLFLLAPELGLPIGRTAEVIAQKVMVYSSIINLGLQAYLIKRHYSEPAAA